MKRPLVHSTHFLLAGCIWGGFVPGASLALTGTTESERIIATADDAEEEPAEPGTIPAELPSKPAVTSVRLSLTDSPEGKALQSVLTKADYRFTPEVRAAYLVFAKAEATADLAGAHQVLPADFLAWVDSNPVVEATVYGAKRSPANILRVLRSLELDLGRDTVRKDYTQLALAMAVSNADEGLKADLKPRDALKLVIPTSTLKPVNTNDPSRPLDVNDHIINFLNTHKPEPDPATAKSPGVSKRTVPPALEKTLIGADVVASKTLQAQFNAYMKSHGQTVTVDCETPRRGVIPPAEIPAIVRAYEMFRSAYVAKGLLPMERDAPPTLAETCAFLIRNDKYEFPEGAKQTWPKFPLTAPWPVLTFLACNRDPLREDEDLWQRFRDTGDPHNGTIVYLGNIAQHPPLPQARTVAPLDFGYGSVQMMVKDGGVCGTTSGIEIRTALALGQPASTFSSRTHCGTIYFRFDPETKTYAFTGGHSLTSTPHALWVFSNPSKRMGNSYHTGVAEAVNAGLQAYLDSTLAFNIYALLPAADKKTHGPALIDSGLTINPYNGLLISAAAEAEPVSQLRLLRNQEERFAKSAEVMKPGCPADTVLLKQNLMAAMLTQPMPTDPQARRDLYAFLQAEKDPLPDAVARYRAVIEGLPALLTSAEAALKAHAISMRTPATCAAMADALGAAARQIPDANRRRAWAQMRLDDLTGHEAYLAGSKIRVDDTVAIAAKLAGSKPRPEKEQIASLLDSQVAQLKAGVNDTRNLATCRQFSNEIIWTSRQLKDEAQKRQWIEALSNAITGHETFQEVVSGKPATRRDPCADTIVRLQASPEAAH